MNRKDVRKARTPGRAWLAAILVLGGAALLGWRLHDRAGPLSPVEPEPSAQRDQDAGVAFAPATVPAPPEPATVDVFPCPPASAVLCHQGDVWSQDGCDRLEQKLEECGDRLCRDARCVGDPDAVCNEPAQGRCDGRSVVYCHAGRVARIDCAAQGLICAVGEEGAECVPPVPPDERCVGGPRCEGDVLVHCELGRKQRVDCGAQHAQCLELPGAHAPRCVAWAAPAVDGCGPCGCPEDPAGELECDGQDEDNDRLVDEGLDCGPVPVIAFVVTDARGNSSYAPEDIEAELARVNHHFALGAPEPRLSFELDGIVELREPEWLSLDSRTISRLADDARVHPAREEFYVPVVFTDQVVAGGNTPKYGVSTLPNGTCGGMQERAGPEVGIIAVSKARAPTTVAHEIGHFLGLCHTHDQGGGQATRVVADAHGTPIAACLNTCSLEGDGVCDTPFDPGPDRCSYDLTCTALCRGGDLPDATNLMSYYTACRQRFSPGQMRLMQHTLALRRGWHACHGGACSCQLGPSDCPAGMACRPVQEAGKLVGRCGLEGPLAPGASCEDTGECGRGALCMRDESRGVTRCTRPCQASSPGCRCIAVRADLSVCAEDLLSAS